MLDFVSIHWFHDWENMFLFKYKVKYWLWTTISKCLQCFSILSKHECVHTFPWVRGHIVYHGPSWSICISKLVPPCAHLKQSQTFKAMNLCNWSFSWLCLHQLQILPLTSWHFFPTFEILDFSVVLFAFTSMDLTRVAASWNYSCISASSH